MFHLYYSYAFWRQQVFKLLLRFFQNIIWPDVMKPKHEAAVMWVIGGGISNGGGLTFVAVSQGSSSILHTASQQDLERSRRRFCLSHPPFTQPHAANMSNLHPSTPAGKDAGLRQPSNGKTIYHRPLNRAKGAELSQASFAYLFGEMVTYAQRRVKGIQELEQR